jgi:uncharacterized membrane protein YjjB (DUF3815 family)
MVFAYGLLTRYFVSIVPPVFALSLCFVVSATARSAPAGFLVSLATVLIDTWTNPHFGSGLAYQSTPGICRS